MIMLSSFSSSIKTKKKEPLIYHINCRQESATVRDLLLKLLLKLFHEEETHAHVKKVIQCLVGIM